MFESFVNSERCKTGRNKADNLIRLRALLIQKDVKQIALQFKTTVCLRALLIQKDVKHGFFSLG